MKKVIKLVIIFCISLVVLCSCSDLVSGKRYYKDVYTMSGLLYAGESLNTKNSIFIGKTQDIEGFSNPTDLIVTNAVVNLLDKTSNINYPLSFGFNLNPMRVGYYDATNTFVVEAGHVYEIQVSVGDQQLSAETKVPDSLSIISVPGYSYVNQEPYESMVYDDIDRDHRMKLETFSPANINLVSEYYCLDEWYEVEYTIQFMGSSSAPEDSSEYESLLTGDPRLYRGYYNFMPHFENGQYVIDLGFNQLCFAFYGRYEIRMYSVDQNYYSYLYKPEGYKHGGIQNGYGYFGSANGQKCWTKVIKRS